MAKGSSKPKDSTSELVARARRGDRVAGDEVAGREMAKLRRWARGKLPRFARDIRDTEDVVQDAMLRTFSRIDTLDVSKPGGLQSYARKTFKEQRHRSRALREPPPLCRGIAGRRRPARDSRGAAGGTRVSGTAARGAGPPVADRPRTHQCPGGSRLAVRQDRARIEEAVRRRRTNCRLPCVPPIAGRARRRGSCHTAPPAVTVRGARS
jgi:DNA-directed RNA polymerase specialized sigma24 family protein